MDSGDTPSISCPHCKRIVDVKLSGLCPKCGKRVIEKWIVGVVAIGFLILFIIMFNYPEGCSGPKSKPNASQEQRRLVSRLSGGGFHRIKPTLV